MFEALGRLALGQLPREPSAIATWAGNGAFAGVGAASASALLVANGVGAVAGIGFAIGTSTSLTLWHATGHGALQAQSTTSIGPIPVERTVVELRSAPVAFLVKFSFVSADVRVWTGFGKLLTLDQQLWSGLGELVQLDGLTAAFGPSAPPGRIVASGVSAELITRARAETAEFVNRPLSIYLQGFNDRALVGLPVPLALRIMTNMEITRDAGTRSIAINHESPYVGRNRPAAAWYTDRDQQKRFPGDTFCDQTPFLLFKREIWPTY